MPVDELLREAITALALAVAGGAVVQVAVAIGRPRRAGDADGWVVLKPGVVLLALCAMSVVGVGFFLIAQFRDIIAPPENAGPASLPLALAFLGCTFIFAWAVVVAFGVRLRFNAEGVERRWLGTPALTPWSQVEAVKSSSLRGPLLTIRGGGSLAVSEYLDGFRDLLVMAEGKAIPVDRALTRKFRLPAKV